MLPRRRIEYRGTTLEEMDLPRILARRPELCLIDELAHSNAPGIEHPERYEDIADVLAADVDVFSTTYVLLGVPPVRRSLGRLSEPMPMRLVRALPEVDVRIVADRAGGEVRSPGA